VVFETEHALAFRPPVPGFGEEHVIVVPKRHVRSLLELDADTATHLLEITQLAARGVVERHGGCQVLTSLGDEQNTIGTCTCTSPPETASPGSSLARKTQP